MKKLILVLISGVATATIATPSKASYTECTIQKTIDPVDRPGGDGVARWAPLPKGKTVVIQSVYNSHTRKGGVKPYDWVFATYWIDEGGDQKWGWVPANVLADCERKDGTP